MGDMIEKFGARGDLAHRALLSATSASSVHLPGIARHAADWDRHPARQMSPSSARRRMYLAVMIEDGAVALMPNPEPAGRIGGANAEGGKRALWRQRRTGLLRRIDNPFPVAKQWRNAGQPAAAFLVIWCGRPTDEADHEWAVAVKGRAP